MKFNDRSNLHFVTNQMYVLQFHHYKEKFRPLGVENFSKKKILQLTLEFKHSFPYSSKHFRIEEYLLKLLNIRQI